MELWKTKIRIYVFPSGRKKKDGILENKNTYIRISLREKKKEWNSEKQKYVYTYFPP
jgi:hypothetical protein